MDAMATKKNTYRNTLATETQGAGARGQQSADGEGFLEEDSHFPLDNLVVLVHQLTIFSLSYNCYSTPHG